MGGETDQTRWQGVRPIYGIRGVWPAIDSLRIDKSGSQNGEGTKVIYSVPAGKKLFVSSAFLSTRVSAAATIYCNLMARDEADDIMFYLYQHKFDLAGQQASGMYFLPALELLEQWDISVYNNHADLDSFGLFHGWLEDM